MGDVASPGREETLSKTSGLAGSDGRERRARVRRTVPDAFVRVGARIFPIHDWSSNSVLLSHCDLAVKPGDTVLAYCNIPLAGERLEFDCEGVVLRTDPARRQVGMLMSGIGKMAQVKIDKYFGEE